MTGVNKSANAKRGIRATLATLADAAVNVREMKYTPTAAGGPISNTASTTAEGARGARMYPHFNQVFEITCHIRQILRMFRSNGAVFTGGVAVTVSRLINRNVVAERGRTSMRLEPELWEALWKFAAGRART